MTGPPSVSAGGSLVLEEFEMHPHSIHHWIVVLSHAYLEYSTWQGHAYYRRTVGYDQVVWC
ncbi:hypothetical protein WT83_05015 [Burkholderia territorii]|uniref:Uncharacterized protein n=1 Tax=Burkholderia territorii TaxID=1503055 RepID=A0A125K937_9BURK|nr:hypothetical protein WT83_05015 [Burkholderia territorii]